MGSEFSDLTSCQQFLKCLLNTVAVFWSPGPSRVTGSYDQHCVEQENRGRMEDDKFSEICSEEEPGYG